jgi:hypothetical protein
VKETIGKSLEEMENEFHSKTSELAATQAKELDQVETGIIKGV